MESFSGNVFTFVIKYSLCGDHQVPREIDRMMITWDIMDGDVEPTNINGAQSKPFSLFFAREKAWQSMAHHQNLSQMSFLRPEKRLGNPVGYMYI